MRTPRRSDGALARPGSGARAGLGARLGAPRGAPGRPGSRARRGAALDRALVVLIAIAVALFVVGLRRDVRAEYGSVRTDRLRLTAPGWVDPRWQQVAAARLAALGPIDATVPTDVARVVDELTALAFVEEVGFPTTIWPDGLRVPLRTADVVACARIGRHFQPLSAEGRVLPGRWPTPPPAGAGFLPVVGPVTADRRHLATGDRLDDAPGLDGLDVARSLWEHCDDRTVERLGRVVIDATNAPRTAPDEPGTRLLLERGREVLFGRVPSADEPGELPVASKWRSVARTLELEVGPDPLDWAVVDVRWDRPELVPREPERR